MPSSTGIRMSISTTSGRDRRTASTASRPSAASATTSSPRAVSTISSPERTRSWSSATTTLRRRHGPTGRLAVSSNRPSRTPVAQLPAEERHPLGDPHQPEAAPAGPAPAAPRVGDHDRDPHGRARHRAAAPFGRRCSAARWSAPPGPSGTPTRRLPRQPAETVSVRSRSTARPLARNPPTRPGRSASPGPGAAPARRPRRGSRAAAARSPRARDGRSPRRRRAPLGAVGVAAHQVLRGRGLHDHGADGVRDDVVQLARDAVPLGTHRLAPDQFLALLEQHLLVGEPTGDPAEDVQAGPPARARTSRPTSCRGRGRSGPDGEVTVSSTQHRPPRRRAANGRAVEPQHDDRDRRRRLVQCRRRPGHHQ